MPCTPPNPTTPAPTLPPNHQWRRTGKGIEARANDSLIPPLRNFADDRSPFCGARLHPGSLAPPRARHGAPATGVVGARTSELRARAIALPCALPLFAGRLVAKVFVERVAVLGLLLRVPASALLPAEHPLVGEKVWLEVLRIGARMPRRHLTTAAATAAAAAATAAAAPATATTTAGSAPDLRPSPLARWEATDVAGTASTAGAGAAATVATAQSAKTSCLGARAHPPSATLRSPQGYSGICSRR